MIDYNVLKVIRGLLHTRSNGVDMTQISYSYIKQQEILDSIIGSVSPKQQKSKDWLIKESSKFLKVIKDPKICIAAGWYGLLGAKLREFTNGEILSFDKDPMCKKLGKKMYKKNYGISFDVADINDFDPKKYDVVICTSCEHITDDELNGFLGKVNTGTLVILQSNNYDIPEHINCKVNVGEFIWSVKDMEILYEGELDVDNYKRFMIIGLV